MRCDLMRLSQNFFEGFAPSAAIASLPSLSFFSMAANCALEWPSGDDDAHPVVCRAPVCVLSPQRPVTRCMLAPPAAPAQVGVGQR